MDFSSIISTANEAFANGKTKPVEWRREQLRQLLKMLDENEEDMVAAMHKDLRKPRNESISYETEYTKNVCRYVRCLILYHLCKVQIFCCPSVPRFALTGRPHFQGTPQRPGRLHGRRVCGQKCAHDARHHFHPPRAVRPRPHHRPVELPGPTQPGADGRRHRRGQRSGRQALGIGPGVGRVHENDSLQVPGSR